MNREQVKLALAIVFLGGSLALLVFQITGSRRAPGNVGSSGPDLTGMMEDGEVAAVVRTSVAWSPPEAGLAVALASNPFLRPGSSGRRRSVSGGDTLPPPHLSGIRMDATPSVVINDRILEEGEAIAGWRVLSIRRDRVTLRNTHGRTIRIDASSLDAK